MQPKNNLKITNQNYQKLLIHFVPSLFYYISGAFQGLSPHVLHYSLGNGLLKVPGVS